MARDATSEGDVLAEQIAYYRERANEYDQWWYRTGRYDRGEEFNAAWFADVGIVEAAVCATLESAKPHNALELACGTGLFTRLLAPRVGALTAVDASPEVIGLNRARVASRNVRYLQADLFEWTPDGHFDCVFMSFWLSHVPHGWFDAFWSMVRNALTPGGIAYVVDSALQPTSTARDHSVLDVQSALVTRKLNDGRQFRIVKVFYEPEVLNERLAGLGFDARLACTPRYFIHGDARVTLRG
ncbi:MAG TPA: class I SAM-dependent methyltransferase [Burkholderiales bacterium]|nr:class I SAM-dependent methyltransferase [Burkholderiales bacterium]